MMLIFYLTFGPVGTLLGDLFDSGIQAVTDLADQA